MLAIDGQWILMKWQRSGVILKGLKKKDYTWTSIHQNKTDILSFHPVIVNKCYSFMLANYCKPVFYTLTYHKPATESNINNIILLLYILQYLSEWWYLNCFKSHIFLSINQTPQNSSWVLICPQHMALLRNVLDPEQTKSFSYFKFFRMEPLWNWGGHSCRC